MEKTDFIFLRDGIYEFHTYVGEKIIGIPTSDTDNQCYIIRPNKIKDYNIHNGSNIEKMKEGIMISIDPEIIEEYNLR
jgi:hypothetical protein